MNPYKQTNNKTKYRLGIPWRSSGQDSAFSLQGPGLDPWSGKQAPASRAAQPKKKKKDKEQTNNDDNNNLLLSAYCAPSTVHCMYYFRGTCINQRSRESKQLVQSHKVCKFHPRLLVILSNPFSTSSTVIAFELAMRLPIQRLYFPFSFAGRYGCAKKRTWQAQDFRKGFRKA